MAVAISGKDLDFKVEISTVMTTIPRYTSVNFGSVSAERIETTHLKSAAKEYIAGLKDFGEVSVSGQFDPNDATHEYLRAAVGTTAESFEVDWPTSPVVRWSFAAIVEGFDVSGGDQSSPASYTLRLKTTGAVTRTVNPT